LWQFVKGRRMYRDNAFEKEAYKKALIDWPDPDDQGR
jgi:hypothetical protein